MTRFPASIDVRFWRVQTRWTLRKENLRGIWMLVPEVDQHIEHQLIPLDDDPWELRNQFFSMKHEEKAAFEFLEQIGVWMALEEQRVSGPAGAQMRGTFGSRLFFGRALPITIEELWKGQDYWRNLFLHGETSLRAAFGKPPAKDAAPFGKPPAKDAAPFEQEQASFAIKSHFSNTLPLHIEWHDDHPQAVIQPITGWEMLVATAQIDLARGAAFQVCQRKDCGIPFTGRRKKYHKWYCGHIENVRLEREQARLKREKEKKEKHAQKR